MSVRERFQVQQTEGVHERGRASERVRDRQRRESDRGREQGGREYLGMLCGYMHTRTHTYWFAHMPATRMHTRDMTIDNSKIEEKLKTYTVIGAVAEPVKLPL